MVTRPPPCLAPAPTTTWLSGASDTSCAAESLTKLRMRGLVSDDTSRETTRATPEAATKASASRTTMEEAPLSAVGSETEPRIASPLAGSSASIKTAESDPAHATARRRLPSGERYAVTPAHPRSRCSVSDESTRGAVASFAVTATTPSPTTNATSSCASTARGDTSSSGATSSAVTARSARTETDARARIAKITARMDAADVKRVAIAETSPAASEARAREGARGGFQSLMLTFRGPLEQVK